MSLYLISIYQPSGAPQPPQEQLDQIMADLDVINKQMQEAGVWVFAGGLDYPSTATVVTTNNGEPVLTDGPYVELKEYVGGFDIVDVEDLDAALGWARRLHEVIGLPLEVRPFFNEYK
ncbi:MAG TPA: YciI family protein [Microlunatus sp.]